MQTNEDGFLVHFDCLMKAGYFIILQFGQNPFPFTTDCKTLFYYMLSNRKDGPNGCCVGPSAKAAASQQAVDDVSAPLLFENMLLFAEILPRSLENVPQNPKQPMNPFNNEFIGTATFDLTVQMVRRICFG